LEVTTLIVLLLAPSYSCQMIIFVGFFHISLQYLKTPPYLQKESRLFLKSSLLLGNEWLAKSDSALNDLLISANQIDSHC